MRVDFFIVGAQKGGTTALDSFLRNFAELHLANVKETHFFDCEEVDWEYPDYTKLHSYFDSALAKVSLCGEATPIYTYWPDALPRLHRYNPKAKLIMGLRHPAFRAFSHWRMEVKRGADALCFRDAIHEPGRRRVSEAPGGVHRVFSYVERGFYASQIKAMLTMFPLDQVFFFRTDTLWRDQNPILDQVCNFLGFKKTLHVDQNYVAPVFTWQPLGMCLEDKKYLNMLFSEDINQTQKLTGLDLSDWGRPDYVEPMRPD